MNVHDFTLRTIDGAEQSLGEHRGHVLLIVNTASQCGFTPQYAGLEKLHQAYEARGLRVLGIPSNDFGAQEPGSDEQIKSFCTDHYDVHFPLYSKIPVKGAGKHPLYAFLTQTPPAGEVKWNFSKFLVGKDGNVIARYESKVTPQDPELVARIEAALAG
jgi:glutathione peroxidase